MTNIRYDHSYYGHHTPKTVTTRPPAVLKKKGTHGQQAWVIGFIDCPACLHAVYVWWGQLHYWEPKMMECWFGETKKSIFLINESHSMLFFVFPASDDFLTRLLETGGHSRRYLLPPKTCSDVIKLSEPNKILRENIHICDLFSVTLTC